MSGATGNPQWHEGQIAQNPSNTARRNPKPDKHHVESRDNLVEISEESQIFRHRFLGHGWSPWLTPTIQTARRLILTERTVETCCLMRPGREGNNLRERLTKARMANDR